MRVGRVSDATKRSGIGTGNNYREVYAQVPDDTEALMAIPIAVLHGERNDRTISPSS